VLPPSSWLNHQVNRSKQFFHNTDTHLPASVFHPSFSQKKKKLQSHHRLKIFPFSFFQQVNIYNRVAFNTILIINGRFHEICFGQNGTVRDLFSSTSCSSVNIIPPIFHTHICSSNMKPTSLFSNTQPGI
jgi:hypothetical protein